MQALRTTHKIYAGDKNLFLFRLILVYKLMKNSNRAAVAIFLLLLIII